MAVNFKQLQRSRLVLVEASGSSEIARALIKALIAVRSILCNKATNQRKFTLDIPENEEENYSYIDI